MQCCILSPCFSDGDYKPAARSDRAVRLKLPERVVLKEQFKPSQNSLRSESRKKNRNEKPHINNLALQRLLELISIFKRWFLKQDLCPCAMVRPDRFKCNLA